MIQLFVYDKSPAYAYQYGWNVIDNYPYRAFDDPEEADEVLRGLVAGPAPSSALIDFWVQRTKETRPAAYERTPLGTVILAVVWDVLVDRVVDGAFTQIAGPTNPEVRWAVRATDFRDFREFPLLRFKHMHLPEWGLVAGGHLTQFIALSMIG